VRGVEIPKKQDGVRLLGIPGVADRVAQATAKLTLEPQIEPFFHENSFGYRPGRSAHDALGITRQRCWKYDYVLEFDIRGMFDNIPWNLIMKALKHHTDEKWIHLYVKRWLEADIVMSFDGSVKQRSKGTPQGGVISPLLMNLFMHYAFDMWMEREFPNLPWCRYADDGLIHCKTVSQAEYVLASLTKRMKDCGLDIHPEKTNIVDCRTSRNQAKTLPSRFDFLGYEFRPRSARDRHGETFTSFLPAVSRLSLKRMRWVLKYKLRFARRVDLSAEQIATWINPIVRGWFQYYAKLYPSAMASLARYLNDLLARWALRKFRKIKGIKKAHAFIRKLFQQRPFLFAHWKFVKVS